MQRLGIGRWQRAVSTNAEIGSGLVIYLSFAMRWMAFGHAGLRFTHVQHSVGQAQSIDCADHFVCVSFAALADQDNLYGAVQEFGIIY